MKCKLIIKDPVLQFFTGKEFDSFQDFKNAFLLNVKNKGLLPFESGFITAISNGTTITLQSSSLELPTDEDALFNLSLDNLLTGTEEQVRNKIEEIFQDLQSPESISQVKANLNSLKLLRELNEFVQADEELSIRIQDEINRFEALLAPLQGEKVSDRNTYYFTHKFFQNERETFMEPKDLSDPNGKMNLLRNQLTNTLLKESESGREFYFRVENDSSELSWYPEGIVPNGIVMVPYEKTKEGLQRVYFESTNNDPTSTGRLTVIPTNENKITLTAPTPKNLIGADVNPEAIQDIETIRANAGNGVYYKASFTKIFPLSKKSILLTEFLNGRKGLFQLKETDDEKVFRKGFAYYTIDGEDIVLDRTPLSEEEQSQVLELLAHTYSPEQLIEVTNYLNKLYENADYQGDIAFVANKNKGTITPILKLGVLNGKIIRLNEPKFVSASDPQVKEVLKVARINLNKKWLENGVRPYMIKDGKVVQSFIDGETFYLNHHSTPVRLSKIGDKFKLIVSNSPVILSLDTLKAEEVSVQREQPKLFTEIEEDKEYNYLTFLEENKEFLLTQSEGSSQSVLLLLFELLSNPNVKAKLENFKIRFSNIPSGTIEKDRITLNLNSVLSGDHSSLIKYFTHETIHALTRDWLSQNPDSELTQRLIGLQETLKGKVHKKYTDSLQEFLTILADDKEVKKLNKTKVGKDLLEKIIDFFTDLINSILGESNELVKDLFTKLTIIATSELAKPKTRTSRFGTRTVGESNIDILGFDNESVVEQLKQEIEREKDRINHKFIVNSIDQLFAEKISEKGLFAKFIAGEIDAEYLFNRIWETLKNKADDLDDAGYEFSPQEIEFYQYIHADSVAPKLKYLWLTNSKLVKASPVKKGDLIKQVLTARVPDAETEEEVVDKTESLIEEITGNDETTSGKLVDQFDDMRGVRISSWDDASKQVRTMVQMIPKFERRNRKVVFYTQEDYDNSLDKNLFFKIGDQYAKKETNIYGQPELSNPVSTWNQLQSILVNKDGLEEMMSALRDKTDFPEGQVLYQWVSQLGISDNDIDFKISFEKSFNKREVNVYVSLLTDGKFTTVIEGQTIYEAAANEIESGFQSNLVNNEKYKPFLDRNAGEFLYSQFRSTYPNDNVLEVMGMYFDPLVKGTETYKVFKQEVERFLEGAERVPTNIGTFIQSKQTINGQVRAGLSGRFKSLIDKEHALNPYLTSRMMKNAAGENQSKDSLPNSLLQDTLYYNTHNLEEVNNKVLRSNNPLFRRSLTQSLLWNNGQRTKTQIIVTNYNGLKKEVSGRRDNNLTINLNDRDWLAMNLATLLRDGKCENTRAETATTSYSFQLSDWDGRKTPILANEINIEEGNIVYSERVWSIFSNYLRGEIERINSLKAEGKWAEGQKFILFADLLSDKVKEDLLNGTDVDNQEVKNDFFLRLNGIYKIYDDLIENTMGGESYFELGYKEALDTQLDWTRLKMFSALNQMVLHVEEVTLFQGDFSTAPKYFKRAKSVQSTGVPVSTTKEFVDKVNEKLRTLSFGQLLGSPLQIGDTYKTATIVDDERSSFFLKALKEGFIESQRAYLIATEGSITAEQEKQIQEDADQIETYAKIIISDGDAFSSPDFNYASLKLVGSMVKEQELAHTALMLDFIKNADVYLKGRLDAFPVLKARHLEGLTEEEESLMKKGLKLIEENKAAFFKRKMTQRGNGFNEDSNTVIANEVMDKFAILPLYPQFIYDKPLAMEYFLTMVREGLGYVKYASGTKIPNEFKPTDTSTFEQGLYEGKVSPFSFKSSTHTVFSDRLFEQIKTPTKSKEVNTFGSQFRKLILDGIRDKYGKKIKFVKGTPNDYINSIFEFSDEIRDEVLSEFGVVRTESGWDWSNLDIQKISTLIARESRSQELPDNISEFFEQMAAGNPVYDKAEETFNQSKVQGILSNIIKQIAVQKVSGVQAVQASSSPYVHESFYTGETQATNDLAFYQYVNDKTLVTKAECKIGLIGDFKNLLNLPEVKEELKNPEYKGQKDSLTKTRALNKLLRDKSFRDKYENQLTMVSYRIPTQGSNSMDVFIIKEFLPTFYGATIILPPEITVKSGTDYDYDKMSLFFPSIDKNGNYIPLNQPTESLEELENKKTELKERLKDKTVTEWAKEYFNETELIKQDLIKTKEELQGVRESIKLIENSDLESDQIELFSLDTEREVLDNYIKILKEEKKELFEQNKENFDKLKAYREAQKELSVIQDKIHRLKNPKKALQNRLIEASANILLEPKLYWKLILPNTTEHIFDTLDKVFSQVGIVQVKDKAGTGIITPHVNFAKWKSVKGKDLLGIAAVWNTFLVLVQEYGLNIQTGTNPFTNEEYLPATVSKTQKYRSVEPFEKSEILSQLINVTVDMPSDDKFGYSNFTFNNFSAACHLIVMRSLSFPFVATLFHQPIIRRFEALRASKSQRETLFHLLGIKTVSRSYVDEFQELRTYTEGVTEDSNTQKLLDQIGFKDNPYYIPTETLIELVGLNTPINPTLKLEPDTDLLRLGGMTDNDRAILTYYLMVLEEADKMRIVQSATNQDTSPDNNINKVVERNRAIAQTLVEGFVEKEGFLRLLNNSIVSALNSSVPMQRISEKIMPIISDTHLTAVFSSVLADSFVSKDAFYKKVNNDFLSSLVQNFAEVETKTGIQSLFSVTEPYLKGDNKFSLTAEASKIKEALLKEGKTLRLLDILTGSTSTRDKESIFNIRLFQGFENSKEDKDQLTQDFKYLLEHHPSFAKGLAYVGILQSGWSKSPLWFSDIIPHEFITPILNSAFDKYLNLSQAEKDSYISSFITKFKFNEGLFLGNSPALKAPFRFKDYRLIWQKPKLEPTIIPIKESVKLEKYELAPGMYANEDQIVALDKIERFLNSKDKVFLLEGRAGSGKTSSINKAISSFRGRVGGATVSDEARTVLQQSMKGKETFTVAKLLGLVADKSGEKLVFRKRNKKEEAEFRAKGKSDPIESLDVVVIDEASMIDKYTYDLIMELLPKRTKIIFMGDRTQLPPIQEKLSQVFERHDKGENYHELTKVMRFLQNAPIFNITEDLFASRIRQAQITNGLIERNPIVNVEDKITDKEIVLYRKPSATIYDDIAQEFKSSKGLKDIVVIADTNESVKEINNQIRSKLFTSDEPYQIGERIRMTAPLVFDKSVVVENNVKGIVVKKVEGKEDNILVFYLTVEFDKVNINGGISKDTQILTVIKPEGKLAYNQKLNELRQEALANKKWFKFYEFQEQFAYIDYAYAMTVHKVQGSTYKSVYVMEYEIYRTGSPRENMEVNQMMRTATSRPTTKLVLVTNKSKDSSSTIVPLSLEQNQPSMEQILFQEDQSSGYAERTRKNASADATIAIAIDFESAGEKLTKKTVLEQKKKYIAVDANNLVVTPERVKGIVASLNSVNAKTLNIAGNGIYTMKGKYTQKQVDDFTYELIKAITTSSELNNKITSIRTGGQTGFDEAGAKAGMRLGIPTLVLAPKGWKFRDINGTDISNERLFKERFIQQPTQLSLFDSSIKTPNNINNIILKYSPVSNKIVNFGFVRNPFSGASEFEKSKSIKIVLEDGSILLLSGGGVIDIPSDNTPLRQYYIKNSKLPFSFVEELDDVYNKLLNLLVTSLPIQEQDNYDTDSEIPNCLT